MTNVLKWKMDKNSKEMKMINGMYFVNTSNAVIKSTYNWNAQFRLLVTLTIRVDLVIAGCRGLFWDLITKSINRAWKSLLSLQKMF